MLKRFKAGGGMLYDLEYLVDKLASALQRLVIGQDMLALHFRSNVGPLNNAVALLVQFQNMQVRVHCSMI